ncbi:hypothetical protein AC578_5542 [Pseudocercospora eumusae]|uniref:Uncharacterized protein n=1 Tax=Pseudocercospora eumusae TaxID=321146 RepID=A0A139H3C3_9PEZI|nr:hypothetical protein AC578_5542 [Pseudocercospora eumusae]
MSPTREYTPEQREAARYYYQQGQVERIRRENEMQRFSHPAQPHEEVNARFTYPRVPYPRPARQPQEDANARISYPGPAGQPREEVNARISHPRILIPGPAGVRKSSSPKELARNRGINQIVEQLIERGIIPPGTDYRMPTSSSSSPSLRQAARQASRASQSLQDLSDTLINMADDNDIEMTDAEADVETARPASRHISWDDRLANSTIDPNAALFPGPADPRATPRDYRQTAPSLHRARRIGALDAIGDKAHRIGRGIRKAISQVGRRPPTPEQHVWARTNRIPVNRSPPRSRAQRQADAEENYYNVMPVRTSSSPTPGAGRGRRATWLDRLENH